MTNRIFFANWTLVFTLAGCLSSGGDLPPDTSPTGSSGFIDSPSGTTQPALPTTRDTMTVARSCGQTECQAAVQRCESIRQETCYSCSDPSCVDACNAGSCGSCGAGGSSCAHWTFDFRLPTDRDEDLYAACHRYWAHAVDCGTTASGDPCNVFARIERHEMVDSYDCYAAVPCDGDTSVCEVTPNDTLAQSLDDHSWDVCGEATDADWRAWVGRAVAWMRPDPIAALRTCLRETDCGSYLTCLNHWTDAVDGSTPPEP
ncbi:MAG: hypothetical protein GXP55_17240 [Deltaproteobacteria bacterium]|nr:hypothetical protein [Deltaproteobacteria bacterium]